MSERFIKLFTAESNLYFDGSPVIIEAGALLKDTATEKIIAQLKILNLSEKTISYLSVYISPLDSMNRRIGEAIAFEYLDICVPTHTEFGSKQPLFMPNASTRAFEICGCDVRFEDGSSWTCEESTWNPIDKDTKALLDSVKYYKQALELSESDCIEDLDKAIELFEKIKDRQSVEEEIKRCEEKIKDIQSVEEEIKRCEEKMLALEEQNLTRKTRKFIQMLGLIFLALIILLMFSILSDLLK